MTHSVFLALYGCHHRAARRGTGVLLAVVTLVALVALVALPGARAGGLFVPGTGTEAMGRAGAFVAKADDPSALHYNPAGLVLIDGTIIHLGSNFLRYSLTFDRSGVYEAPAGIDEPYEGNEYAAVTNQASPNFGLGRFQSVPLLAAAFDLGRWIPGLHGGAGILAPNAYPGRDFGTYTLEAPGVAPPPQRYDIVHQDAIVILPSIAAAYTMNSKLSLGLRMSWGIARLEATSYTWAIRNYQEWIGDDSEFVVEVTDRFVPGLALGALYRPVPDVVIGAAYTTRLAVAGRGTGRATLGHNSVTGDADVIAPLAPQNTPGCAAGGELGALQTCIDFVLPQTFALGGRWILARDRSGGELADIEFDAVWEDWSAGSNYQVIVDGQSQLTGFPLQTSIVRHGLQDVLSVRLGGSYALPVGNPGNGGASGRPLVVRAGVAHDTAAAPLTWQRVDVDGAARTTFATGLSYRVSRYRIDLAGAIVVEPDRTVPSCEPDVGSEGCPPGSGQAAVTDRTAPDPLQPLIAPSLQFQDPFNGGTYSSHYLMFSLGFTAYL